MEEILKQYQKLAYSIAGQYRNKGIPLEDLRQESLIGLMKAVEHYKEDSEASFATYAAYWIRKHIYALFKAENAFPDEEDIKPEQRPDNAAANRHSKELKLPIELPEIERTIIMLSYVEQLTLKEIAGKLEISVEKVSQYKKKALRRLKCGGFNPLQYDA